MTEQATGEVVTEVETDRPVNLEQLAGETDCGSLSMADYGVHRVIRCNGTDCTVETLQAAVAAHEPEPLPPTPLEQLQQQVAELVAQLNPEN